MNDFFHSGFVTRSGNRVVERASRQVAPFHARLCRANEMVLTSLSLSFLHLSVRSLICRWSAFGRAAICRRRFLEDGFCLGFRERVLGFVAPGAIFILGVLSESWETARHGDRIREG